jgi:DNA-binding LacI/PurR family transcriptional regulator
MPRTANRRSAPRIRDVAERAGVSVATVSRVLNGTSPVAPDKGARVLQAVDALGYRPSSLARGLSLGRTQAIGVIAPFFTHPATVGRLRGVTERVARAEHDLTIFNVETPRQRADAFSRFARPDRIDGVIVISLALTDDEVAALRAERLPAVLVDAAHPDVSRVVIDDVAGGRIATEHLLRRGHTRIGFVGDEPASPLGFTSSERRWEGHRRALADAGIAADPGLAHRGPYGRPEARRAAGELLRGPQPPTAVFAASDVQAIGALEAAAEAGLRVPQDLAVIGFDDIEAAEIVGLTTVRQPLEDSGARGVELLLGELAGDGARPAEELLPLTVVERRTT